MSALTSSRVVKVHYGFPGNRLPSMTKPRVLFMRSWRVFYICANYNNVFGRWIITQYLRQIKENSKLNNGGFNKWLEMLAGDLRTKLRKTENLENVDFIFSANITAQRRQTLSTRARGCKEATTKYYNYTANEADEEREHRLPTFQRNAVNRIRNKTDEDREASLQSNLSSSMQR